MASGLERCPLPDRARSRRRGHRHWVRTAIHLEGVDDEGREVEEVGGYVEQYLLVLSGFVIVTETRFGSHSPISRLHLCDSSSSIPFSCSSVPILDWLQTEAKASVALAGGPPKSQPRCSPLAQGPWGWGVARRLAWGWRWKGRLVVNASPVTSRKVGGLMKNLPSVAALTAKRDGEIRKAALNTLATTYKNLRTETESMLMACGIPFAKGFH
ncbi:uncharacterized protein LOC120647994 [Panicum virgatum]|uniref:uncharacterized protein LOC120647994 n=1 Tax=Panicum virgatum TaxID=38727 RepID=UPI0019D685BD|nr:uncharacterized protein LOC120647994 [Panicum virgatum]